MHWKQCRRGIDLLAHLVLSRQPEFALLFGALTVYALTNDVQWSIALPQPFTLQYAREAVGREHRHSPDFVHLTSSPS